jgi:carbon-monoxide dehydrogenase large subunit
MTRAPVRPATGVEAPVEEPGGNWWSRREDVRLLTGAAAYAADVDRDNQLFLRVVRSPVAHGEVRGVNVAEALEVPGVVRILTGKDLGSVPVIPLRILTRPELEQFLQPVLAVDRVRYVGEPLAVVVATSAARAEDAADLVDVDIVPLQPAVDVRGERQVPVWPHATGDVMCRFVAQNGNVDRALAEADVVVTHEFCTGRDTGLPLETRALVAEWDEAGVLHLWGPAKFLKFTRETVASWFRLETDEVLCHHVDVGGMFGPRGEVYPEDFLVPWAASVVKAPVKWVEDLNEHLQAINHSRGQTHRITAAARRSGELLALRAESLVDYGAYARPIGGRVAELVVEGLSGPYRWESLDLVCRAVSTNKTPTGTMRGPSTFDTTFARERTLDLLAAELGWDPIDLRRHNLIRADELPYLQSFGRGTAHESLPAEDPAHPAPGIDVPVHDVTYDSGDYHEVLRRLLEHVSLSEIVADIDRRRRRGEIVGYGIACFLDHSGLGREESIRLDLTEGGHFRYVTIGSEIGQGLASMVAKVGAAALGVPEERIDVVTNDTSDFGAGNGTFASRSTIFVGSAALDAAVQLREAVADEVGRSSDVSGDLPWERATPRTVVGRHESAVPTFGFGAHLAVVSVDPATADVTVEKLAVAYDCGRAVDMESVKGQLVGAAVQGLGGTLFQELSFDEAGQPQSTTFMDFLVPTLTETPGVDVLVLELPGTTSNPLGVKGAGEAGIMGVGGAVANAVSSALKAPAAIDRLPIHPDAILPFLPPITTPSALSAGRDETRSVPSSPGPVAALGDRARTLLLLATAALGALAVVLSIRKVKSRLDG